MLQCGGSLYPVFLDAVIEEALFGNAVPTHNNNASKSAPPAALVLSGLRTVIAAHCKLPGLCVAVCRMVQPILWTGILKGNAVFLNL